MLDKARLYPSLREAVADLRHVYASTARDRYMVKREVTPRLAAQEMRGWLAAGEPCGVVFGPERTGLVNEDITLADTVLNVPLNPGFSSLNLAQAVLIVGYEWFIASQDPPDEIMHTGHSRPANKEELIRFFDHFEEALMRKRVYPPSRQAPEPVPQSAQFLSARLPTEQELRTLHGVVTSFMGARAGRSGGDRDDTP